MSQQPENTPESRQPEQTAPTEQTEQSTIFTAPEREEQKKSGGFKKSLLILLVVLVLAVISTLAIVFFVPSASSTEVAETTAASTFSITESANVALEDMKNADENAISNIKNIHLDNENGQLDVIPYSTKDEEGEDAVGYKMVGHDDLPQEDSTLSQLATDVFELSAIRALDGDWTEEQCGLTEPSITVTVTMADNSEFSFRLGDKVPSGNGYYYGTSTLQDGIYILDGDNFSKFNYGVTDLIDTTLVTAVESEGDDDEYFTNDTLVKYDSMTISGSRFSSPLEFSYVEDADESLLYRITSPVRTYADDEKISELLTPVASGLLAAEAICANPTAADYEKYGLAEPATIIEYVVKGHTYTLRFSEANATTEAYYNCTVDDIPVIYSVMSEINGYVAYTLADIRSSLMFLRNIETVKALTVEYGGQSLKYELSFDDVIEDEDATTATDSTSATEEQSVITVLHNSKPVEAEEFQTIYQQIILVQAADYLATGASAPSGTPTLRLTFSFNNGKADEVLAFTEYDERYFSYTINGLGDALVRYDTIDDIIDNFVRLQSGEKVIAAG